MSSRRNLRSENKHAQDSVQDVQFVSWNILSSALAQPWAFKQCDPVNLDKNTRLERMKTIMTPHIEARAIIALQEVSREYLCGWTPYFKYHNYAVASSNYGNPKNDYMGCLIAYPCEMELVEMDIKRISKTKSWPAPPSPSRLQAWGAWLHPKGWYERACETASDTKYRLHSVAMKMLGKRPPKKVWNDDKLDAFAETQKKENTAVMVRLRKEGIDGTFVVATYHMPCVYWCPPLMSIHASLVVKAVQKFAGEDFYVLAGDFNFTPSHAQYALVTQGSLPEDSKARPVYSNPNDKWRVDLDNPVASAYKLKNGKEPELSYYSRMWGQPMFEDTLDYLFLPADCEHEVVSVIPLLTKEDLKDCKSLPDEHVPSDHLLLGATIRFPTF